MIFFRACCFFPFGPQQQQQQQQCNNNMNKLKLELVIDGWIGVTAFERI